jgi:hypothetical protein
MIEKQKLIEIVGIANVSDEAETLAEYSKDMSFVDQLAVRRARVDATDPADWSWMDVGRRAQPRKTAVPELRPGRYGERSA